MSGEFTWACLGALTLAMYLLLRPTVMLWLLGTRLVARGWDHPEDLRLVGRVIEEAGNAIAMQDGLGLTAHQRAALLEAVTVLREPEENDHASLYGPLPR